MHPLIYAPSRTLVVPEEKLYFGRSRNIRGRSRIRGGVSVWTPKRLSGLVAWYAPEDWTLAAGKIATWADSSGNGKNLSQPTAARRPIPSAAWLNGLAGAAFNAGSTTRLRTSAINLTAYNKLSIAAVFSDALASAMHTFGFGDVAGDVGSVSLRQNWAGAGLVSPYSLGFNTCWQDTLPTTDSCATPAAWLMTCDFALANYHKLYKNNSEIALRTIIGGAPGASLGNHAFGVGGRAIAYSPTYSVTGVFGEIILTTGLMSSDDRAKLQTYFHNTWGL